DPGLPNPDLRDIVRARIRAAYHAHGGNISATARSLGVSRNTVYRGLDLAIPATPSPPGRDDRSGRAGL
ncbi:helix-turn-helix domain-containing protein, partial [Acidiphilium sp.]|uniref:helix-turn-helix domain-containing protein n=1 Tax=Acidiphilium sp. TaxID=527 RepID=UPI003D038C92